MDTEFRGVAAVVSAGVSGHLSPGIPSDLFTQLKGLNSPLDLEFYSYCNITFFPNWAREFGFVAGGEMRMHIIGQE